jgi:hypothetical protein
MAPLLVLILRLLQGLALVVNMVEEPTYVAEHAPVGQRMDFLDSNYCNGGFVHLFNGNSCYKKS